MNWEWPKLFFRAFRTDSLFYGVIFNRKPNTLSKLRAFLGKSFVYDDFSKNYYLSGKNSIFQLTDGDCIAIYEDGSYSVIDRAIFDNNYSVIKEEIAYSPVISFIRKFEWKYMIPFAIFFMAIGWLTGTWFNF